MPAAAAKPSPVAATVDFAADGIQHGHLKLPYSRDDSAWGAIMIPIAVVKRGEGPTALLTGANHGDEYEGPVALFDLARTLRAEEVTGRVIILPAMNYPAFRAGTRTSPIDKGNMNRIFPGKADGTVTEKIADYIQRHLLPMADVVLDIHSGGKTLEFVPFAAVHLLGDKAQEARCAAAMAAFNAPYSVMLLELDAVGMYDTAAEAMGKTFVSTELGGGGTARASTVRIAKRGVRNLLIHAGILAGAVERQPSIHLDMPDGDCYLMSPHGGLLEFCVDLGERVCRGDLVARLYDPERTGGAPTDCRARRDGILAGRHFPGLIQTGDTIAVIGVPTITE
ncbi:MAG TPA: N(2)-acetyl-L-2,4-diaminobutanoate deacetylase DoeB [Stellaceae bacterium]|nr:N(2)-acetyl-L-2,4-diaminobutanoate deacetylase DoeB [Stellaceae bacterium]